MIYPYSGNLDNILPMETKMEMLEWWMGIGFEVQMLSNTKYGDPGWTPLKQNKKKTQKKN